MKEEGDAEIKLKMIEDKRMNNGRRKCWNKVENYE